MCCAVGRGGSEGRRDSDNWDLGACDPGAGYGICLWFGKISTKWNPGFVVPPLFLQVGFEIQGWVGIWWIPKCAGSSFRLWFALVWHFFETPFSRKRPAIEMIEMIPPLFLQVWFEIQGGVEFGGFPSVPDPRFAYGLP